MIDRNRFSPDAGGDDDNDDDQKTTVESVFETTTTNTMKTTKIVELKTLTSTSDELKDEVITGRKLFLKKKERRGERGNLLKFKTPQQDS